MQALSGREAYDPRADQPARREGGRKRESGCPSSGQQGEGAITKGRWVSAPREARIQLTVIPAPSTAPDDGLSLRCRGARGSCRLGDATLIAWGCAATCHDGASTTRSVDTPAWATRSREAGDSIPAPRHANAASTPTARAAGRTRRGGGRRGFKASTSYGGVYHHTNGSGSPHTNFTSTTERRGLQCLKGGTWGERLGSHFVAWLLASETLAPRLPFCGLASGKRDACPTYW